MRNRKLITGFKLKNCLATQPEWSSFYEAPAEQKSGNGGWKKSPKKKLKNKLII